MFLRLNRVGGLSVAETDMMVRGFLDGTYPRGDLATMNGFLGYAAAADRENGRVCAMSLWETARAMTASDRVARKARAEQLTEIATEPVVDTYDVALQRFAQDLRLGGADGYIRLCRVAGLVDARVRKMIKGFADNAREVERLPGFESYLVAGNMRDGKVTSFSRWRTLEELEASERVAARAREQRLEDVKPYRRPAVERYELVVVRDRVELAIAA